jgi:hypothetical protein
MPKQYKELPPQEKLWECFDVDLWSGLLIKKPRKSLSIKLGTFGSRSHKGYVYGMLDGCKFYAHRLVWVWFYGDIPNHMEIDHVDRDRSNNCIFNLRLATKRQQALNTTKYSNNLSGYKGVTRKPWGAYVARIRVNGKYIHIGCFKSAEEAHIAYTKAAAYHFGDYSCAG